MFGATQAAILPAELAVRPERSDREREAARRDDAALMREVAAGDPRAQEALVLRVLPYLRAIARSLLGEGADADDAVQLALMRVLRAAKDYRAEGALERWARRIAVRTCLRLARQERRHRQARDPDAELAEVAAVLPGPRLSDSLPRDVAQYLSRLPDAQREALLLRHALDYSVAEIAELTAAPVDTVKSRLLFGRRALRKLVRQDLAIARAKTTLPRETTTEEKRHA